MGTTTLPVVAQTPTEVTTPQTTSDPNALVQEAKKLYQNQKYSEALPLLEQAATAFATRNDIRNQAMTVDFQGQVYLALGQPEVAVQKFALAATTYERAGDKTGAIKSGINEAQALRKAGLYRRALDTLKQLNENLTDQTDPLLKTIIKLSLGITQRLIGDLDEAQKSIEESLKIAETLPSPARDENLSTGYLVLGNIAKDRRNGQQAGSNTNNSNNSNDRGNSNTSGTNENLNYFEQAIANYKKAAETATTPTAKVEAQLNQLSVFGDSEQPFTDTERQLLGEIRQTLDKLPLSRTAIHARINWARMMMEFNNEGNVNAQDIVEQLAIALEQARKLQDSRSESYALGQLGELRQKLGQLDQARENTQQALAIAQSIGASDITYRWQWQLAQILNEQGKTEGALASYDIALKNLESIRGDLVSLNPDAQFSFRKSVEPVYREYAGLLLADGKPENLEKARQAIESLQQSQLVNFFRENCLTAKPVKIDDIDKKAAVIYPIVLADRLEVILSLSGDRFEHHSVRVSRVEVQDSFKKLRNAIASPTRSPVNRKVYLEMGKQAYTWLIRPFEDKIAASGVETLVFVLDGPMLNIPMSVLHDGEKFLVEKYAIAQTPGLQLLESKPVEWSELTVLKGGVSKAREVTLSTSRTINFDPLPGVEQELEALTKEVPGEVLLNEEFTTDAIQKAIESFPFPVVHLATHGEFSSKAEETFILTGDDVLLVNQLGSVLRGREERGARAIELLVLSACKTALGDERAALGLAGVAVKSGARSTLASLWPVDDKATADLMVQFYHELKNPQISKAKALQNAQMWLMQKEDANYKSPYYWAPFVLVGNWR